MIDLDRQLEYMIEVQREMSRNRPARERVQAFVAVADALSPTDLWCGVIVGAEEASYHVLALGALDPETIDQRVVQAMLQGPGDRPRLSGGVIGGLISSGGPRIVDPLEVPGDDPALGHVADRIRSAIAVPLFWDGRVVGWSISFSEASGRYDPLTLAMAFNSANLILQAVARDDLFTRVARLHARVAEQVEGVARTQRSLLPDAVPSVPGYRFAVSYRPCEAAGGDYYDFMEYPDGRIGTVIADVSGHGTSAAVTMAVMCAAMSGYRVSGRGPATVVEHVNRVLRDAIPEGVFVTALFVLLDPATGDCIHLTCGHPPALIRRSDGSVERLDDCGGPPLAVLDDIAFEPSQPFRLERGDTLFLYTDGINEAFAPDRTMFGYDRLGTVLERHDGDAASMIDAVAASVASHAQRAELDDDQTMVAVRRDP